MRIRTIRPEFYESETIGMASWNARLLFIALWSYVEDNGVNRDNARLIRGACFPYDGDGIIERIEDSLDELERIGCIHRYTQGGKRLLWIPNFSRYQKIDRPSLTHFDTPDEYSTSTREYSSSTRKQLSSTGKTVENKPKTDDNEQTLASTREYSMDTRDRSGSRSRSSKRNSPYRESKESASRSHPHDAEDFVEAELLPLDAPHAEPSDQSETGMEAEHAHDASAANHAPAGDGEPETPTTPNPVAPAEAARRPSTPMDDWRPKPRHYKLAEELGVDCDDQAARMRDWYASRAKKPSWKDFDRAFNNWLRHGRDLGQTKARRESGAAVSRSQANQDANMRLVMQIAAESAANGTDQPSFREEDFR